MTDQTIDNKLIRKIMEVHKHHKQKLNKYIFECTVVLHKLVSGCNGWPIISGSRRHVWCFWSSTVQHQTPEDRLKFSSINIPSNRAVNIVGLREYRVLIAQEEKANTVTWLSESRNGKRRLKRKSEWWERCKKQETQSLVKRPSSRTPFMSPHFINSY